MSRIKLIGYGCGIGSENTDSKYGARHLMAHMAKDVQLSRIEWGGIVGEEYWEHPQRSFDSIPIVSTVCHKLANKVSAAINCGDFPIVVGGDHASAIGTWSGVACADASSNVGEHVGMIWIDAHMDSHTTATTPSGYAHGMPIAALLGFGDPRFASLIGTAPKFSPQSTCIIGVRSYEPEEAVFLNALGIRYYLMDEVKQRGFGKIFDEALDFVESNSRRFGVSIDLDGLDPGDAPGTGTAVDDGIRREELLASLDRIIGNPSLVGLELAEFNPRLDIHDRTCELLCEIISKFNDCPYYRSRF